MDDLLDEMRQCKSVQACIDLALTDAYGEDEEAVAWLTCIEAMFGRYKRVKLLGEDVALVGFDLSAANVSHPLVHHPRAPLASVGDQPEDRLRLAAFPAG